MLIECIFFKKIFKLIFLKFAALPSRLDSLVGTVRPTVRL